MHDDKKLTARARASVAVLTLLIATYSIAAAALIWVIVAKPFEH